MRSRLFASFILFLLVILPVSLYWYFYHKKVSKIVIATTTRENYTAELEGKLEYTYFPLFDKVFRYKSDCIGSCEFSPIPPLFYKLRISTEGREDIVTDIPLMIGSTYRYTLVLPPVFLMGTGVIGDNNYALSPDPSGRIHITASGSERDILTDFPLDIIHVLYQDDHWIVRTSDGLFLHDGETWQKNPRFTHMIDLSSRYRVGYIDKRDERLLSIANLESGFSYIVLLDRASTDMTIMKKGFDMRGFVLLDGKPAILREGGETIPFDIKNLP